MANRKLNLQILIVFFEREREKLLLSLVCEGGLTQANCYFPSIFYFIKKIKPTFSLNFIKKVTYPLKISYPSQVAYSTRNEKELLKVNYFNTEREN